MTLHFVLMTPVDFFWKTIKSNEKHLSIQLLTLAAKIHLRIYFYYLLSRPPFPLPSQSLWSV